MSAELLHIMERPENWAAGLGLIALGMSFTFRQRKAIKERDQNKCQATVLHKCNGKQYPLEVDHIVPQAYGYHMGLSEDQIDSPENALTKCREAHDRKHPERVIARQDYGTNKQDPTYNMSEDLKRQAHDKLNRRQVYWNEEADRTDYVRALQLTNKAEKKGWSFPPKMKKK